MEYIEKIPMTIELDKIINRYDTCNNFFNDYIRKIPDKPNIKFGNIDMKYNKFYYLYIIICMNEICIDCQDSNNKSCYINDKMEIFFKKKIKMNK